MLSREKEKIWHSPMTKAITTTENSKTQSDNTITPQNIFHYTTTEDRLGTVNRSNDSHSTDVVTQFD